MQIPASAQTDQERARLLVAAARGNLFSSFFLACVRVFTRQLILERAGAVLRCPLSAAGGLPRLSGTAAIMTTTKPKTSAGTSTAKYKPVLITSFPDVPLLTTFTPPADCSGIYSSTVAIVDGSTSCLPSGFSRAATAFFSPGIACPSGYYSACHDTTGVHSITTVTCCPFRHDISLSCVDPATLSSLWTTLFCRWTAPSSGTTVSITLSSGGITSTIESTMSAPNAIDAFGVRMVYESTDMPVATTTSPHGTTTASPTTSTSAPQTHASSGLSRGAIAAISIIIPVVVIAAFIGAFLWWRRRKVAYSEVKSAASPLQKEPSGRRRSYGGEGRPPGENEEQDIYGDQWSHSGARQAHQLSELPAEAPAELPADGVR